MEWWRKIYISSEIKCPNIKEKNEIKRIGIIRKWNRRKRNFFLSKIRIFYIFLKMLKVFFFLKNCCFSNYAPFKYYFYTHLNFSLYLNSVQTSFPLKKFSTLNDINTHGFPWLVVTIYISASLCILVKVNSEMLFFINRNFLLSFLKG